MRRSRAGRILCDRRLVVSLSVALALVAAGLTGRFFVETGWPLDDADGLLVAVAGVLCLLAHAARTLGWRRLFAPAERPHLLALAAAGGAATVTSVALPGRLDAVVRVAVVRRFPGAPAGLGAVCLSLLLLGMVEAAALTPLAGVAAGTGHASGWLRAGLIVVAAAGAGSLAAVFALPRVAGVPQLGRFRVVRWLHERAARPGEAAVAFVLVFASWVCRAAALFVLLHALGLRTSVPLALVLLCATAASTVVPVAPAGAAMQAGAAAGVLAATGVGASSAIAFGLAAQLLLVLAGVALALLAAAADLCRRLLAAASRRLAAA
jgi:uncharacterized membrane protein YbhN (UPF0104 family)